MPELDNLPEPAPAQVPQPAPSTTEASSTVTTTTTTATGKPGYKTTEFWLQLLVGVVNALVIGDVLVPGSQAMKFVSVIALVLQALGYNMMRAKAKAVPPLLALLCGGLILGGGSASLSGCGAQSKGLARTVAGDVVDCTKGEALELADQLTPTFEQLLQRSLGGDGSIDTPSVADATSHLKAAAWCSVERAAARLIATIPLPGSPASSPQDPDPEKLRAALAKIREQRFGGVTFKLQGDPQ